MSSELVRKLTGIGTVYRGDVILLEGTNYDISVYQEILEGSLHEGHYRIRGAFEPIGTIEGALPIGQPLKLNTGNGYSIEFMVLDSHGSMAVAVILDNDGKSLF